MSNQDSPKKERFYWLALNGPSVAATMTPLSKDLMVSPVPEQLLGFSSYQEAKETQQFLLTAPPHKLPKFMKALILRIRSGEVQYIRPRNPEPWDKCGTIWQDGPALVQ